MQVDTVEIEIYYRGKSQLFTIELQPFGYSYRMITHINGQEVIFEPDEERKIRARTESLSNQEASFRELVQLIGEELQQQLLG